MRRLLELLVICSLIGMVLALGQMGARSAGVREGPPAPAVALPAVTVAPSVAGAAPPPGPPAERSGEATFYDPVAVGACSFDHEPPGGLVAAVGPAAFADSAACGSFIEVRGPRGAVVVRVVDLCPGCGPDHIDLSREAFVQVADPALGRATIRWLPASPHLDGPIAYRFKPGSSEWWLAVQVINHRNPVAELAYRGPDGAWVPLLRGADNYFVSPGPAGPGPYTMRLVDRYGNQLIDSVPLTPGGVASGAAQFPPAP